MSEAQSATAADAFGRDLPLAVAPIRISWISWYALGILTIINVFGYMDRAAISILLEAIKTDLHLSDQKLGLLSGLAFAAFHATLGLPLAWFADRTVRVRLISACLALWSVMTALSGLARNFPQLFLARMGVGVGEAGCVPPAHSLIADYFPRHRRALAICIFQAGAAIGMSAGLFFTGILGQNFGWRVSLQIVGLLGLPIALLTVMTLREPRRPPSTEGSKESLWQAAGALLRRPAFVHLAIALSVSAICTTGVSQWIPTFLMRSFGMSMASAGAWVGLTTGINGVLGLVGGGVIAMWLIPRDGRWELWLPAATFSLAVPLYALMFLSPSPWLVLILKALATLIISIGNGVGLAAVQSFTEPHRRATAVSLTLFFTSLLGMGAGPYVIGALSDLLMPALGKESLRYALLVTCPVLVWAVTHYLLSAREALNDRLN
jgi:predicted MFS family arabinose efflux permease